MSFFNYMNDEDFAFDARWIGDHGIGRFAREISRRIPMKMVYLPGRPSAPLDFFRLSLMMMLRRRFFFSPGYVTPFLGLDRFVFCVHDLNHIDRPENSSLLKRIYYRTILRFACRRAAAILTVSDYSRRRIVEWSGVSHDKIFNVGNGVSEIYNNNVVACARDFPYLLCVGNRKKHKNEARIIEAFAKSGAPESYRLLMTGFPSDELVSVADKFDITNRISYIGRVEEADLPGLYRGARALVFPSLYEGFGLPVIEAMACGTPVITSLTTSLPEVCGGAALLVDPESVAEISYAISRILYDNKLHADLSNRGMVRAKDFTWDDVAIKVKAVLDMVKNKSLV